jgi:hypothetical protein
MSPESFDEFGNIRRIKDEAHESEKLDKRQLRVALGDRHMIDHEEEHVIDLDQDAHIVKQGRVARRLLGHAPEPVEHRHGPDGPPSMLVAAYFHRHTHQHGPN